LDLGFNLLAFLAGLAGNLFSFSREENYFFKRFGLFAFRAFDFDYSKGRNG
jgi:hypothetical protein